MLLDVRLLKYLVSMPYFSKFTLWIFKRQSGAIERLRLVAKLLLSLRIAGSTSKNQFAQYGKMVQSLSWVWYGSDGTRIQLYDSDNLVIGKLPLLFNREQFSAEIEARNQLGDLCPPIIRTNSENGLILERWIDLRSVPAEQESGLQALELLKGKLFAPVRMDVREYVKRYSHTPYSNQVCDTAVRNGISDVIVSLCHGDLWHGNIFLTPEGKTLILDWEYCGTRVQSYDAWFFTFFRWAAEKRHCEGVFFTLLGETFHTVYAESFSLRTLHIIHMLHLFERYASHLSLGKLSSSPEMEYLRAELSVTIQGLCAAS